MRTPGIHDNSLQRKLEGLYQNNYTTNCKHKINTNNINVHSNPLLQLATTVAVVLVASAVAWRCQLSDRDVLQRQFWDFVYDRYSSLYDSIDWVTFDAAQKLRLKALAYLPPHESTEQHILEVGVGTGRLHLELAKRPNTKLAGFDLAPGMIELTRHRLHDIAQSDLKQGDVTKGLPWEDNTFDVVLSTFVLSAISNATVACQEMARILKPGGSLMIIDAGTAQDGNRKATFLAWLSELMGDYMRDDDSILKEIGMVDVTREDYGPSGSVHLTVGKKTV